MGNEARDDLATGVYTGCFGVVIIGSATRSNALHHVGQMELDEQAVVVNVGGEPHSLE